MSILSTNLDKTTTTKSVILFYVKTAPEELVNWLKSSMKERNWGIRETAQHVGVSHPTISDIVTSGKLPSFDTCLALANTFGKSPVYLLRLAGMLPQEPEISPHKEELIHILDQLDPEEQDELLDFAKIKLERQQRTFNQQTSRHNHPARSVLKEQ
jgi:transcriptional regulator with XRE-family HTH domain